jgi:hypothetical protein
LAFDINNWNSYVMNRNIHVVHFIYMDLSNVNMLWSLYLSKLAWLHMISQSLFSLSRQGIKDYQLWLITIYFYHFRPKDAIRIWRYPRGNQNSHIEGRQITQWTIIFRFTVDSWKMKRKGHFIKQQALGELLEIFNRFKDDSYFEHSIICKFTRLRLKT